VILVADQGQRQDRTAEFAAKTGPPAILSDDAKTYTEAVPVFQQQATRDPYLNGKDTQRRGGSDV
jgi:hypothetical protein